MPSSIQQVERMAVQLCEARRLASYEDVPHGRLALLLLDNAAETSLRRSAERRFVWAEWHNNMAYLLRDAQEDDEEAQRLKRALEPETLSRRRRKQIERNFDSLVEFVFEDPDVNLSPEFATCLSILHRYRNAAHHRDEIRPDVLGPAVQIYFFLCCHLFKTDRPLMLEIGQPPAIFHEMCGDDAPESMWPGGGYDSSTLADLMADRLLSDLNLEHDRIAGILANHLLARLAALDAHLDLIGDFIPPGMNRWATLRIVQQAPKEREEFDAEPSPDFWTKPLPVTEETLAGWEEGAQRLSEHNVAHDALHEFAEIEQPLEALEEPVGRFLEDIDRMEQQQIDEMRGK